MWPIIFACASLCCAAVNDVVFKLFARTQRPVGIYLAFIGVIDAAAFILLGTPQRLLHCDQTTLFWGLLCGAFSISANLLLMAALARHEVGICSAIYRLNLAPAALLAFLFLGEEATTWKLLGIAAAVGSILVLTQRTDARRGDARGLWLVAIASLLRAAMGVAYKCGLSSGGDPYPMLAINGIIWIVCGLVYGWWIERRLTFSRPVLRYGLVSGVLVVGIVLFLIHALQQGDASTVLPIAQLSFLGSALIGAVFLQEALTRRKLAGLSLALLCIILMAAGQ